MANTTTKTEWINLAKIAQASFFNRRALEWKLALGFWGAIAAFTGAVLADKVEIGVEILPQVSCIYWILWIVSLLCWKLPLQIAHATDKRFQVYYMQRAGNRSTEHPKDWREGKRPNWTKKDKCGFVWWIIGSFYYLQVNSVVWLIGQAAFSACFLQLSYLLICGKVK